MKKISSVTFQMNPSNSVKLHQEIYNHKPLREVAKEKNQKHTKDNKMKKPVKKFYSLLHYPESIKARFNINLGSHHTYHINFKTAVTLKFLGIEKIQDFEL